MPFDIETPSYVIDGDALFARAMYLSRALEKCQFSYSVKTLAVPEAVLIAREAGWCIEVVSRDEYNFVRALGVDPKKMILNGPSKENDLLTEALLGGAIVHADSEEELTRAVTIRASVDSGRVGVRLGFGVTDPRWARFGIDVGEMDAAVRTIAKLSDGQAPNGFHVHSGTNRGSLQEFLTIAGRAINFARAYSSFAQTKIEWIDFGGGFPDSSVAPVGAAIWSPPEIEQFVRSTSALFVDSCEPVPSLIFEPGRAVVGPCVDLFSRVETVKSVAGVQVATLDAGVNTLPFARAFSYPVELCEARDSQPMQTVLCGPLCMADDVIRFDANLPALARGDVLRIRGVGAYNVSMSFDFIRRRAAIFLKRGEQIRRTHSMFS